MNLLNRIMSYDKTKLNQENCNCEECVSSETVKSENQIVEYPKLSEEEIEQIIKERYSNKDEKTKIFIRKALRKHGDRYDYSNVIYVKATVNVEIICRVEGHKPFPQKPSNHLQGQGCKFCGFEKLANEKRLTKEEFIERANKVYGVGRYDYSEVEYIDMKTEIWVICHKHDKPYRFRQTPNHHIEGHGCKKCMGEKLANERRKTLEKFIEESNEVHGDGAYDYSKVTYVNYNTDVIIICPIHGDFPQTPRDHLSGCDCPKCNKNKGEESIRKFLTKYNIEFEEQKTFEGCRNVNLLRFDFYLPKYNLCIESDGVPHFKKIKWTKEMTEEQMEEKFEYVQNNDKIKDEYCKKNNITLLRVKANKAIEELSEYFQNNRIVTI